MTKTNWPARLTIKHLEGKIRLYSQRSRYAHENGDVELRDKYAAFVAAVQQEVISLQLRLCI